MQVVIEAGFGRVLGGKTAAVVEPTLDNEDVESSLGEIGAEHEAVMASANDDAIVVVFKGVHVCSLVLRLRAPLPAAGRTGKNNGYFAQRRADGKHETEAFNAFARPWRALGQNSHWPTRSRRPGASIRRVAILRPHRRQGCRRPRAGSRQSRADRAMPKAATRSPAPWCRWCRRARHQPGA